MKRIRFSALLFLAPLALLPAGCLEEKSPYPPLSPVAYVDLERYTGRWYEVARIANSFQKGCVISTADYSLEEDGYVKVINRCRKGGPDGKEAIAEGKAWVVDKTSNAWLKVQFFWPFKGDYVIIDLDEESYRYAVVGHPTRNYLWILSRTPYLDDDTYDAILSRLLDQGYDIDRIKRSFPYRKNK